MPRIDLDAVPRDPGWRLEPVLLSTFCRAAAVVLQRFHTPPHPVAIMDGDALHSATLMWSTPDSRALATHANSPGATEYGAYALAFAALRRLGPYIVLRRADHSSGADFVLARRTERGDHQILLLEVSGLANGSPSAVERRLRQQARAGHRTRPRIAGARSRRTLPPPDHPDRPCSLCNTSMTPAANSRACWPSRRTAC